ncbi:cation diffusion facilitator family transporter [Tahibacter amnicola]|uniref:Cation diffusion facilitator family transporter n=1 Tax=Tahibacter amnicola TaxID=2976241 RepID=A0ABY6BIH4_9GAMM|nr:cation diffusion facilitator family transporter [Tahibacter amnicola]UXI69564.1 cation diffusion facilitator family transporter [Tahibacter amnicola]
MAGKADSVKTILYALGANFAIFVAKLVASILTGSGSMLAEAVHSLADCGNQGLLLLGLKRSKKPPSDDFPLGYGKTIYFWSFLVALMLFSVGGIFSIYEGIHKLQHPEALRWPWLAVGVLTFGIIAEAFSMWGCVVEVNKARGDQSLWRWFRDSRQSELIVIFGEDLAALLGLVFALIAVLLTMVTGNPMYDAGGSIMIGVLLIVVAVFIAIEVKALLIGQGVEPRQKKEMLEFLHAQPEIKRVFNLLTLQMGTDIMVAIKAEMSRYLSPKDMIADINRVEAAFRQKFPDVRWCFFEPDSAD